jgi:DNA-binding LacI/PurR family transcriptional regulator
MAVSVLVRLMDNDHLEPPHVELATRLVVRSSTTAAPTR